MPGMAGWFLVSCWIGRSPVRASIVNPTRSGILAVQVVNQTPEPDGSFREFWLRVPPTVMTARQAVAWTFGLSTADHDPVAQS